MDNAGGHGTKDCIDEYIKLLKDKFNIIIKHQVPQSPEMNLLDLGIWNSFQSFVEKTHRGQSTSHIALHDSVTKAWENYLSIDIFKKVFERWKKVLEIIINDKGSNNNIGNHRRQLTSPLFSMDKNEEKSN